MAKREVSKIRDLPGMDSDTDIESINEPDRRSFWGSLSQYLYNPRDGTCCQRTSKQWITLSIYFIAYTAFIVILFVAFLYGIVFGIKHFYSDFSMIDRETLIHSAHPGLGFVPNIVVTKHPIIWYSSDPSEERTEVEYVKSLDKFFQKYKSAKEEDYVKCPEAARSSKLCYFDLKLMKDCMGDNYFYTNSSLCFFLKLNRRKHWKPIYFKEEHDLPDEMSQTMMDHILTSSNKDVIYVECLGKNLWDSEHMGKVNYYPKQGFDGYYFPYEGESEYLPPLVAVQLKDVTTGIVIHIQCTVWAKNIELRLNHLEIKIFIDNTLPY